MSVKGLKNGVCYNFEQKVCKTQDAAPSSKRFVKFVKGCKTVDARPVQAKDLFRLRRPETGYPKNLSPGRTTDDDPPFMGTQL